MPYSNVLISHQNLVSLMPLGGRIINSKVFTYKVGRTGKLLRYSRFYLLFGASIRSVATAVMLITSNGFHISVRLNSIVEKAGQ